jgi:hypothetical protein
MAIQEISTQPIKHLVEIVTDPILESPPLPDEETRGGFVGRNLPPSSLGLFDLDDPVIKLPSVFPQQPHTAYIITAVAFMEKMEALGRSGLEFTEENCDRILQMIQETTKEVKKAERLIEESHRQSNWWETASHITGGIIDIASICIGAALLASGNPLSILAGIGMIVSGVISFSCLILERTGTKNDVTLGFQIAGGVIGVIGGIGFFTSTTGSAKIVLQIAVGLITAATYGSKGASYIHQQDSLKEEAKSERLTADLFQNKDQFDLASKFLFTLDERILENSMCIIKALHLEEDNVRRLVNNQLIRG